MALVQTPCSPVTTGSVPTQYGYSNIGIVPASSAVPTLADYCSGKSSSEQTRNQQCTYRADAAIHYFLPTVVDITVATIIVNVTQYPDTVVTRSTTVFKNPSATAAEIASIETSLYPSAHKIDASKDSPTTVQVVYGSTYSDDNGLVVTSGTPVADILLWDITATPLCGNGDATPQACDLGSSSTPNRLILPLPVDDPTWNYIELEGVNPDLYIPGLDDALEMVESQLSGCSGLGTGFPSPKVMVNIQTVTSSIAHPGTTTHAIDVAPTEATGVSRTDEDDAEQAPYQYGQPIMKNNLVVRGINDSTSVPTTSAQEAGRAHNEKSVTDVSTPRVTSPGVVGEPLVVHTEKEDDSGIDTPAPTTQDEMSKTIVPFAHTEKDVTTVDLPDPTSFAPVVFTAHFEDPGTSIATPTPEPEQETQKKPAVATAASQEDCQVNNSCGSSKGSDNVGQGQTTAGSSGVDAVVSFRPGASEVAVGDQTVTLNGPAATISGMQVSLGSSGLVIGGSSTIALPTASGSSDSAPIVVNGQTYTYQPGASTLVVGSATLTQGGAPVTVDGTVLRLETNGVVVYSSSTLALPTAAPSDGAAVFSVSGTAYTYRSGDSSLVIGSVTVSANGPAVTLDGQTISIGSSGVVLVNPKTTMTLAGASSRTSSSSPTITTAAITRISGTSSAPAATSSKGGVDKLESKSFTALLTSLLVLTVTTLGFIGG